MDQCFLNHGGDVFQQALTLCLVLMEDTSSCGHCKEFIPLDLLASLDLKKQAPV